MITGCAVVAACVGGCWTAAAVFAPCVVPALTVTREADASVLGISAAPAEVWLWSSLSCRGDVAFAAITTAEVITDLSGYEQLT